MACFSTTAGVSCGQREITFILDDESGIQPLWLIDYLDKEIGAGKRFESGQTVQIGWMILRLKEGADEALELWEPEFDSIPIRWRRGVNHTMRHLLMQKFVCDAVGCEPWFPSLQHAGIVSPKFTESFEFAMSRDAPCGNDTGWVFTVPGYAGTEGGFQSLYHIVLLHMEVIPFLALPPGSKVSKCGGQIEIVFGGRRVRGAENEFLRRLMDGRDLG